MNQGAKENLEITAAQDLLSALGEKLRAGQNIRLSINWIVEEGGTDL